MGQSSSSAVPCWGEAASNFRAGSPRPRVPSPEGLCLEVREADVPLLSDSCVGTDHPRPSPSNKGPPSLETWGEQSCHTGHTLCCTLCTPSWPRGPNLKKPSKPPLA